MTVLEKQPATAGAQPLTGVAKMKAEFEPVQVIVNGYRQYLVPSHPLVQQAYDRRVAGEDDYGQYVIIPLGNRAAGFLHGHVFLVSPEDEKVARNYNWCGNVTGNGIDIRRSETISGKRYSILLKQELNNRLFDAAGMRVYSKYHTLDLRRENLSLNKVFKQKYKTLRGVTEIRDKYLQVQKTWLGLNAYIGIAPDWDTGYRMFNDVLRQEKWDEWDNAKHLIHAVPYNDIAPRFTDGDDEQPPIKMAG